MPRCRRRGGGRTTPPPSPPTRGGGKESALSPLPLWEGVRGRGQARGKSDFAAAAISRGSSHIRNRRACCRCRCAAGRSRGRIRRARDRLHQAGDEDVVVGRGQEFVAAALPFAGRQQVPSGSACDRGELADAAVEGDMRQCEAEVDAGALDHPVPALDAAGRVGHVIVAQAHVERRQRRHLLARRSRRPSAAAPDRWRRRARGRRRAGLRGSGP